MTSDTQHAESGSIDRRTFIKGVGATGVAGVGMSGRGPTSAVGGAQALPPFVVAGAAAAAGYAVREISIAAREETTDGLGPDALTNQVIQIATARESTNRSTILDNRNILDGMENIAYTDGKIAAIEELNTEASLEDVQDAADSAAREHIKTIQENLIKSWEEASREFIGLYDSVAESSLDMFDVFGFDTSETNSGYDDPQPFELAEETIELADGTSRTYDTTYFSTSTSSTSGQRDGTLEISGTEDDRDYYVENYLVGDDPMNMDDPIELFITEWGHLWGNIEGVLDTVTGGLQNWTANVYSEVQSGEIDVADLLTPREQAELLADDEEYPQAVADLVALNIPVDPDREATISFDDRDITITGLMAPTSPPENGFQTGEGYDPAAEEWDLYFTYDPALGSGGWNEVEPTISQGELVFTAEPYEGTIYRVPTNQGTVEVVTDEFDAEGDTWVADVSGQLERTAEEWTDFETGIDGGTVTFGSLPDEPTDFEIVTNQGDTEVVAASSFTEVDGSYEADTDLGIAEIAEVTAEIDRAYVDEDDSTSVYAEDGETGYETIQVSDPFTIESIENSDGEEVGETEFSRTEPQDDENYITQEEWDELQEQNQELIERYEDATNDGGLFGGGGWDPFSDGIPEIPGGAAAAAGVAVVVVGFGVLRQIASLYLPGR